MNAKIYPSLTDEQLARQLQLGDRKAMEELYTRYYMLVFNKCLSFVKNTQEATDLTQDIMLKVMEKISTFRGDAKFSTWLYAITFNFCTDHSRKNKKRFYVGLESSLNLEDHSKEELVMAMEKEIESGIAEKALNAISEEDQQLLRMKYLFNKSISELQAMYNLSASAVKMRLMRAKAKAYCIYRSHTRVAA